MKTKSFLSALGSLALVALPASAQVDLSRIAWLGDSVGAGFSNNCLARNGQVDSIGAILARTTGADYQQPIFSEPGQGGCLTLKSLSPLSFGTKASTGLPTNLTLARPYNNLSIGGCAIGDMVRAKTAADTRGGACGAFIDATLRNSSLNLGPMVDQAAALNPTFVVLENIGNDFLGAVLTGTAIDGVTVTPLASFTADYKTALAKLKAKQANGVVFGVVDVTNVAFATTLPPVVLNPATNTPVLVNGAPVPLLGPTGCPTGVPACPIPLTSLVTLNASAFMSSGFGIPCAVAPTLPNCNKPLPDNANPQTGTPGVILYPSEIALLKTRAAEYTTAVIVATAEVGYKYYDTNAFFNKVRAGVTYGGMTVNTAFLTGGAVSYDGFHPTSIGYALIAEDLVRFINKSFGASLPLPDLSAFFFDGNTSGGLPALLSPAQEYQAIREIFNEDMVRSVASFIPFPGTSAKISQDEPGPQTPSEDLE